MRLSKGMRSIGERSRGGSQSDAGNQESTGPRSNSDQESTRARGKVKKVTWPSKYLGGTQKQIEVEQYQIEIGRLLETSFFLNFQYSHQLGGQKFLEDMAKKLANDPETAEESGFYDPMSPSRLLEQMKRQPTKIILSDYDICLNGLYKYGETHESIKAQLRNADQQSWIIEDYFQKGLGAQKQAYFLLKSKMQFRSQPSDTSNEYLPDKDDWNIENVKDQNFKKKLLSKTWTRNIRQIFSELIAFKIYTHLYHVETQERLFIFRDKKEGEKKVINFREEPCVVFYYFIDNDITKEKFEQQIKCIKPLMRYWFHSFNAILNVCGFSPKTQFQKKLDFAQHQLEILRKQINKLKLKRALEIQQTFSPEQPEKE